MTPWKDVLFLCYLMLQSATIFAVVYPLTTWILLELFMPLFMPIGPSPFRKLAAFFVSASTGSTVVILD